MHTVPNLLIFRGLACILADLRLVLPQLVPRPTGWSTHMEESRVSVKPRAKRRPVRPAQIARAVDEGRESLDLYLDEISRVPLLNREEEMELARKAFKGSLAAQERLARHNV